MHQPSISFCQRLRTCRTSQEDSAQHCVIRAVFCTLFSIWLIVAKVFSLLNFTSPQCIRDEFLTLSKSMNVYLANHPVLLKVMIVVTSWNIDLSLLVFSFLFIFYYRSWRLCFWALMFYISRAILQIFFGLHIPSDYLWRDPGVPSLFVPYTIGDFFYSGHVGLLLAISMEFYHYKHYWLSLTTTMFNVYNTVVLVVTRSHYSIDILGGLIFSHYFYIMSGYLCDWLETKGLYQRKIKPVEGEPWGESKDEEQAHLMSLQGDSGGPRNPV